MSDLIKSMSVAASGMQAQSQRLRHVSENIANADTPGYHRKTISFRDAVDGEGVRPGPVRLDRSDLVKIFDPGHPLADDSGHYDGSNVDLVIEIADAREAQRSYEANLKLFDQARQMTQSLFEILRG
ncbi:flagellar basal body rod protein FlgC [Pseudorhodobacter sp. E13]|uniref:flagellar basal body rod protein FlgC n=1 Tax=Pseudorhodobacter sp. E13 TaxID=2487931 RepID=UPI000F8D6FE0|nr:flagellar basal body rod protein FlgC [Pseudorhodobacter sp. E13]RUS59751.1 flagellar basal body rod protein FlgC [Pseudorhodobacter sp. E13]